MIPESLRVPTVVMRGRRFGIYDSMVSIAGLAALLAFSGPLFRDLAVQSWNMVKSIASYMEAVNSAGPTQILLSHLGSVVSSLLWSFVRMVDLLVLILTPVFLLMRLGRPRPTIGALLRQPGTVACLAVVFGSVWVAGLLHAFYFGTLNDKMVPTIAAGACVAIAWTCLALSRQWRSESSWIDRMGRAIGISSIVAGSIAYLMFGI